MTPALKGTLARRGSPLANVSEQLRILRETSSVPEFQDKLSAHGCGQLSADKIEIFQINVGKLCNQTCHPCHGDAGPDRSEIMDRATAEICMEALAKSDIPKVDITGGAPELNPNFRWLVERSRKLDRHVMDRCNLTVLGVRGQEDLPEFLASQRVEVICSLPYFQARETDRQRGIGVFDRSVDALRKLNAVGYGQPDTGLIL